VRATVQPTAVLIKKLITRKIRHMGHVRGRPIPDASRNVAHVPASDFADEFPDAEVTGTDISPIQSVWVPPNVVLYAMPTLS
jgi:hypothetical protein